MKNRVTNLQIYRVGESSQAAIRRMQKTDSQFQISGVKGSISFFQRVFHHPAFIRIDFGTHFFERYIVCSSLCAVLEEC